ncbi:hypothetical protein GCM10010842_40340 [Deinococcus daejeonensis]|uniref:Uncharacterized protein n=2 Tax=Deinococcus daejeonensis TaxID=1007098 RepID=A0ABQ2JKG9_9DEIO|nr:hypothetical protein GCM10010842_40340 [Deinococcus daejeonensis]
MTRILGLMKSAKLALCLSILYSVSYSAGQTVKPIQWQYAEYKQGVLPDGALFYRFISPTTDISAKNFKEFAEKLSIKNTISSENLTIFNYLGGFGWELVSCQRSVTQLGYAGNVVSDNCTFKKQVTSK